MQIMSCSLWRSSRMRKEFHRGIYSRILQHWFREGARLYGRRFTTVDKRPGIKTDRSAWPKSTHPRVRLLEIRRQFTENHCDWAFSIAVESTRFPSAPKYRGRAFSLSVESIRPPDISEYWNRAFSVERTRFPAISVYRDQVFSIECTRLPNISEHQNKYSRSPSSVLDFLKLQKHAFPTEHP